MLFQVLVFDGFDELDAVAPWEILRRAAARKPGWQVDLVTIDGVDEVTAAFGLRVRTGGDKLGQSETPDVIVVPGGGWVAWSPRGARAEVERGIAPEMLARLSRQGTILAAVCTGAMLLASAGLLKNRRAITHHSAIEELRAFGAEIVHSRVVDDGNIISAGGVTSGLDLGLYLVERFASPEQAREIAGQMEYERAGLA